MDSALENVAGVGILASLSYLSYRSYKKGKKILSVCPEDK